MTEFYALVYAKTGENQRPSRKDRGTACRILRENRDPGRLRRCMQAFVEGSGDCNLNRRAGTRVYAFGWFATQIETLGTLTARDTGKSGATFVPPAPLTEADRQDVERTVFAQGKIMDQILQRRFSENPGRSAPSAAFA